MLRERQRRLLVVRPEVPGPESVPEPVLDQPELPHKPELTMPGFRARAASVSVARLPGETANRTPRRRRPQCQFQLSRPSEVRALLPFHVWPAYPCLSPGHCAQDRYPAKFKKLRSGFVRPERCMMVNAERRHWRAAEVCANAAPEAPQDGVASRCRWPGTPRQELMAPLQAEAEADPARTRHDQVDAEKQAEYVDAVNRPARQDQQAEQQRDDG